MRIIRKWICLITALSMLAAIPSASANAVELQSDLSDTGAFAYQHDPIQNPAAMKDIVRDESAVYGFRPSESGSLKQYAAMDWSDAALVESGREERIAYHNSLETMYDTLRQMEAEGKSAEEIARTMSKMRNDLRIESYKDDPEGLALMKARNLEKYGHEEGPLPDELYAQYGSWEKVTEKAFSTNVGMDACLGLYDDYYFLYVALGQVGDPANAILGDTDGDGCVTILDATVIQRVLAQMPTVIYIEAYADADADGVVTVLDATEIRRYLVRLPANEGVGKPIA